MSVGTSILAALLGIAKLAAFCGAAVGVLWLAYWLCDRRAARRAVTAEAVIDQIQEIVEGPIGHGEDQVAVWYSKLHGVRRVIEDYRESA